MRRLLITAFEPFGGEAVNASLLALSALPDRLEGWEIRKAVLPVVFGEAGEKATALTEEWKPDVVLCLGQAGGRKQVTPELLAINLQYARIPDNAGNSPMDLPVIPEGPAAYFTALPVREMARAMTEAGFPAAVSYSAGAYVCNDLFYRLLHRFRDTEIRVDFIHVPAVTDLDPAQAAGAILAAIRSLTNTGAYPEI